MNSPFRTIIDGSDRALFIGEDINWIAVLEKKPLVLGHVTVISKREIDNIFDLSDSELSSLMVFSKEISRCIQKCIPCKKVGVAVIGLETRHAHLHLVPISSADDLNFTKSKLNVSESVLLQTASQLKAALSN